MNIETFMIHRMKQSQVHLLLHHLDEVIVFTNDVKVNALDFVSFYVS